MAILFGNAASRSQSKNLLEFKAGKMTLKGNMVHPDKRKGLVYVHQTDDSLMHFCWKDRTSGAVEDDLIIFPDDVEYKRVAQCTTGRVYVLKFKSTNRKCFFWMQEPKTEKDDEYCTKVNEYLNNPPAPGSNRSGGSTPGALSAELAGEGDLQNLFSAMNQQQFMQLLGGMGGVGGMANLSSLLGSHSLGGSQFGGPTSQRSLRRSAQSAASAAATPSTTTAAASTTTSATVSTSAAITAVTTPTTASATVTTAQPTPVPSATNSQIQLSDLQNILSGISVQPGTENQASQQAAVDLSTAMTSEALQPILSNPEFMQSLQAFLPSTGEASSTSTEQLRSTVQSPQFQQAVSMFSAALQSGQLGPLMQQFGLGDDVATAAAQGDLEAFVNALQTSQGKGDGKPEKKDSQEGGKDKDKDDDDEEMALD